MIVTDVIGSTKAIEAGRYKHVNGVGVASIVALLNALKPLKIPYVFGGDGATTCIPESAKAQALIALGTAKALAEEQFGLSLRIGWVSAREIYEAGYQVRVAKFQPHNAFDQAMFYGDGLGYAESLIKSKTTDQYLVESTATSQPELFEGFECRWNEVPSPEEETIALLVQARADCNEQQDRIYQQILNSVKDIYGEEEHYHPLRERNLKMAMSPNKLSVEARIRSHKKSSWSYLAYQLKLQYLRLVGMWLMAKNIQTEHTNWGAYKQRLIMNSDFQKFDEMLRMIISGSSSKRRQLRAVLDQYYKQGKIFYGIHADRSSLITCVVTDYELDHVHFLDCANGGYALAAKELKAQIKEHT